MNIGYCSHTTCLRSDNLELIEQAITSILEQEGYYFIPQPAQVITQTERITEQYSLC